LQKWVAAARLPKSIETAYALTIHKSQGSEFRHVAVVLEAHAAQLLSKELIYTAITRAKKAVSLLAAPSALAAAMTVRTARKSGLSAKISQQLQGNGG
ncbi:ATP-binding domain-containing protein, partial [Acinetobacter sp.]